MRSTYWNLSWATNFILDQVMRLADIGLVLFQFWKYGQSLTWNQGWRACSLYPCFRNSEFARMSPPCFIHQIFLAGSRQLYSDEETSTRYKGVLLWCTKNRFVIHNKVLDFFSHIFHTEDFCAFAFVWNNCVAKEDISPPSGPRIAPAMILCSLHTWIYC